MTISDNELSHISEKPWSDYKESDYTLDQYYNACLIRPSKDELTSKNQCKLPVKTPGGALSRAGVFAAAAALAGARAELQASPEDKTKAAKTLIGYYDDLGTEPPESIKLLAGVALKQMADIGESALEHHGVLGMRWGVRRSSSELGYASSTRPSSRTAASHLSDAQLREAVARMRLEQDYKNLLASQTAAERARTNNFVKTLVKENASRQVQRLARSGGDVAVEKGVAKFGGPFGEEVSKALKASRKK